MVVSKLTKPEELHLSPQEYGLMTDKLAELSRIRADGSVDRAEFNTWVMRRFGLLPFICYRIVVD